MSARFLETDGDIREVLQVLFASPEFRSRQAFQAKVKTPYEFVVSALRAGGAVPETDGPGLLKALNALGQPLYLCQPPTGYSEVASTWVNAGAMLSRMTFATRLAAGRIDGASELQGLEGSPSEPSAFARRLLGLEPSEAVLEALNRSETDGTLDSGGRRSNGARGRGSWSAFRDSVEGPSGSAMRTLAALVLGSPDFQKR